MLAFLCSVLQAASPAGGQAPALVAPMYLESTPPPVRCAQHILLTPRASTSDADQVRAWSELETETQALLERLRAGADFGAEAVQVSDAPDARTGACLGAMPRGVLHPQFESFLWNAEVGAMSAPIRTDAGFTLLKRVPERVGVRLLVVSLDNRARAAEVAQSLAAGADFAELAAQYNEDATLRERQGAFAVLERGPRDVLLKKLAFELAPMMISAPQQWPSGLTWVRAEDPAGFAAELVEPSFVRLRALLLSYEGARLAPPGARAQPEAKRFLDELRARAESQRQANPTHDPAVYAQDVYARLCAAFTDEPGGRDRAGDLGWIHRDLPNCPDPLLRSLVLPVGGLSEVLSDARGFWLVRRER